MKGLYPSALKALREISAEHRITQTINSSTEPSNYHGIDAVVEGKSYTGAVDISVRCLSRDQIRQFLSTLANSGFVAWYREPSVAIGYGLPQSVDRAEPLRSQIRAIITGRTAVLGRLAVVMCAALLITPVLAAVPKGYTGVVDVTHIEGWTCDVDAYSEPVWVHFYNETGFIGATLANIEREPAVAKACGGYSAHGFYWNWPMELRDGRSHTYFSYAINIGTGPNRLLPAPTTFTIPPFGSVDIADANHVEGWACDRLSPEAALVITFSDAYGATIGTALADIQREPAVGESCGGNAAHGFYFVWPCSVRNQRRHSVRVSVRPIGRSAELAVPNAPVNVEIPLGCATAAMLPSSESPKFRFGDGTTANNQPSYFLGRPDMPEFANSGWAVIQWNKLEYLKPWVMYRNAPPNADPILGTPLFAFPTASNESQLLVFRAANDNLVHQFHSEHGYHTPGGSTNLFLQVVPDSDELSNMLGPAIYSVDMKLKDLALFFASPDQRAQCTTPDGKCKVFGMIFTGFTFQFTNPTNNRVQNLFLQIGHYDTRPGPRPSPDTFYSVAVGSPLYGYLMPGDPALTGPVANDLLVNLKFDLNKYLCDAAVRSYPKDSIPPSTFTFPSSARELANWRLTSLYVGVEHSEGEQGERPQGAIAMTVQISNPKVTKYTQARQSCAPY